MAVIVLEELVHEGATAAMIHPGILLAGIQPEWHRSVEGEGRVFAHVVVIGSVTAFDRTGLDSVQHLQTGHDFAGGKNADRELAAGCRIHAVGDNFTGTVNGVEALRETRSHAPADFRLALGDCRGRKAGGNTHTAGAGKGSAFKELASLHFYLLPV